MNSLIGYRSGKIPPQSKKLPKNPYLPGNVYKGVLNEAGYKYIYICGVTNVYANNLHVVVRYAKGETVIHEDKHARVVVRNAERVPIPIIDAATAARLDRGYQFTTCRNFMFGYAYLRDTDPYNGKTAAEAGIYGSGSASSYSKKRTEVKAESGKMRKRLKDVGSHVFIPPRFVKRK
jgi:hypothetical protein